MAESIVHVLQDLIEAHQPFDFFLESLPDKTFRVDAARRITPVPAPFPKPTVIRLGDEALHKRQLEGVLARLTAVGGTYLPGDDDVFVRQADFLDVMARLANEELALPTRWRGTTPEAWQRVIEGVLEPACFGLVSLREVRSALEERPAQVLDSLLADD